MVEPICIRSFERIARLRVDEKEYEVATRVQYSVENHNGCKVYFIGQIDFAD